jgi:thioredoxin 1
LDLLTYTALGLAVTWVVYLLYLQVATRAAEGRPAEPLYPLFPDLANSRGKALVYCFSPRCGPCRPMSKDVDGLVATGAPVFKLDITENPNLARELGIRATPTLMLIEDGHVARMLIGVKDTGYMQQLITPAAGGAN